MTRRRYFLIYRHKLHVLFALLLAALPFIIFWYVIPTPGFDRQSFILDLGFSTVRLVVAFFISVTLALIFGLTLSRGKVGDIFLPIFDVMQSFPTFAMLPLAIRVFGKSDTTVIFFLVVTMIWPILFAIVSSLRVVKNEWEEAATIYGAVGWKRIVYFFVPLSYPGLITGAIVGLGEGWEAVVGAEIIVGLEAHGLGGFFGVAHLSGPLVVTGVFALLLFIFAINKIIWLPLLHKSHKLLSE